MRFQFPFSRAGLLLFAGLLCQFPGPVCADEPTVHVSQALEIHLKEATSLLEQAGANANQLLGQASVNANEAVTRALELVGIRYRRGGISPETGFDCSGFVSHVFREGLGLILPHNARAMSKTGEVVKKDELQPGDLVFFNTMRRTFSHVGIYLGEHLFVHAPASGGEVRVEDMRGSYWGKRFNGARRMAAE